MKFNRTTSTLNYITCVVPSGSMLGPLRILIYINDLITVPDITLTIMFADGTSSFIQCKYIHEMEITMNSEIKIAIRMA